MGPSLGWLLSISLWAPFFFTCAHQCDDQFGLLDVLDGDQMDLLSSWSTSSPGRGSFLRIRASFPDAWISVLCPGRRGPGCHWPPLISKNSSVYSHHDSLSCALQLLQCFDRYSLLQFILLIWRRSHTASMCGDIWDSGAYEMTLKSASRCKPASHILWFPVGAWSPSSPQCYRGFCCWYPLSSCHTNPTETDPQKLTTHLQDVIHSP